MAGDLGECRWGGQGSVGMGRFEHRYAKRRLERFIDDELSLMQLDRVAMHLVQCSDCSADVRFLLRVRASLGDLID